VFESGPSGGPHAPPERSFTGRQGLQGYAKVPERRSARQCGAVPLGDRLTVGQQTLTLLIVVRIHVPQPFIPRLCKFSGIAIGLRYVGTLSHIATRGPLAWQIIFTGAAAGIIGGDDSRSTSL
jgi:hypothetical protein